jgi:hypothetical protein
MFVDAQVSSMKISCSGSRSSWSSNHSSRRFRMPGRSCSVACVFFARDPAPREEPPYRAECDLSAVIPQKCLQLGQGYARSRIVSLQDQLGMRLDPHQTSISGLLWWRRRSPLACKLLPSDSAGRADIEPYRGLPT